MPDGLGDGGLGAKTARRVGRGVFGDGAEPRPAARAAVVRRRLTAEAAFTVALGVVAFVDGGAEAVGLVAFAGMVPAALFTPVATAFADRFPRDRVLVWSCLTRAAATGAAAAVLLAGGPSVVVYPLAVVSTCAFRRTEPRNLSRLRIAVDALA